MIRRYRTRTDLAAALGDCRTPAQRLADAHRTLAFGTPRYDVPAHLRQQAIALRDAVLRNVDYARAGSPQRRALLALAGRLYAAAQGETPAAEIPALLDEARRAIGVLL